METERCECDACEVIRDIGHAIGCDHTDDPDGRRQLVRCVRESVDDQGQQYDVFDIVGCRPVFAIQKLVLRYVPTQIKRTMYLVFFTRYFVIGFGVGGIEKSATK